MTTLAADALGCGTPARLSAVQVPFSLVDVFAERPLTGNPLASSPWSKSARCSGVGWMIRASSPPLCAWRTETSARICRRRWFRPGAPHLLVQARDRDAVDRAPPDVARLAAALAAAGSEGCYLYSLDPVNPASAAYARFFTPRWASPRILRPARPPGRSPGERVTIAGAAIVTAEGTMRL